TLEPDGKVFMFVGSAVGPAGGATALREIDLAGDPLLETNINALHAELAAMGQHSINDLSHDIQRLPSGDIAVLAGSPRTVNLNGKPTTYEGDMVLVLNQNLQVNWVWDPFQWLDTNRLPTLGEGPSDWTHANSIDWSPTDGDLLV